ncbi:hybrid sensor histidine kinase/response regulator transcription factor [Chitinophaga defluvii]|uniref:histidine kinase n=1 Tax=Chitinophaga defluvii TaxID=3163343 RepID=A0ABV2TED9_9BACT
MYKLLITYCCLLCCSLQAQPSLPALPGKDSYTLRQIDHRNGLSNSSIMCLYEDSDHLMWIATWDGLNMFDGSMCKVFNYNSKDIGHSIGNNVIRQVMEDKAGNIWVVTIEGVSRYSKASGDFRHYFYKDSSFKNVTKKDFRILKNSKGDLYCFSKKAALEKYDSLHDRFTGIKLEKAGNIVQKPMIDSNDRLWIMDNNGGLDVYIPAATGFTRLKNFASSLGYVYDYFLVEGKIYVVTDQRRLYGINDRLEAEYITTLKANVRHMIVFNKLFVFANTQKGYQVYDRNFDPVNTLDAVMAPLKETTIDALCVAGGKLWCGTDGIGVQCIAPSHRIFYEMPQKGGNLPGDFRMVRAFCEVNGDLWVGTKANGIITLRSFFKDPGNPVIGKRITAPQEIDNNKIYSICKGRDSLLYIGIDGEGINLYDMARNKFVKWNDVEKGGQSADLRFVFAILPDADGTMWLGTDGAGLVNLRVGRTAAGGYKLLHYRQYLYDGTAAGPPNDIIYSLAHGNDNRLWVGSRYGGLNVFDKKTGVFKTFKAFTYEESLSHNDVLALYEDGNDRLWIGTSYGLNWMNEQDWKLAEPVFHKINRDDGLPSNTIHAITGTPEGNVWASTNNGLVYVDPSSRSVRRFQDTDGLQCNEFCDGAVWNDDNGWVFFGGIYGFNYFPVQNLEGSDAPFNLLLKELRLAGKMQHAFFVLKPGAASARELKVKPGDNYFEMKARIINFSGAEKAEYAWFLEGYDKVWHYEGNNGNISYYNIQPGTYVLKIKWSNGEGKWMEGAAFTLQVQQYFWLRWPALLGYLLIIGMAGYLFARYRRNKTKIRHQLEMEKQLRLKDDLLHKEQLTFFTNITHELQTPLTLINSSVDRFLYKERQRTEVRSDSIHFISIVQQQASRLIYLVNQVLDFRKVAAGHLATSYSCFDISGLLSGIALLFEPLSIQENRHYLVAVEAGIEGYSDKDKLEKIVFNLLSNAFKHSGYAHEVSFSVQRQIAAQQLELKVTNSGCQLSDYQLQRIFDDYFVVNDKAGEQYSHGIGLTFTRQLIELLEGTITVSREDSWITFTVQVPLRSGHQQAAETVKPSYLLQSITDGSVGDAGLPVTEYNKRALIHTLETEDPVAVLIVDDEQGIRYLLRDILQEHYIVYEAENGRQALEILSANLPDLVISDVMMPELDGLALCRKLKDRPETCHIPVILLSAKGAVDEKTEGYDSGADAYIPKPFQTRYLLTRVRKLLEYRRQIRELLKQQDPGSAIFKEDIPDEDRVFLQSMMKVIIDHMEDIDLDAAFLEKQLAMSKIQLYRKLKSLANMTPAEFIRHIRMQKAVYYLEHSQMTVTEIAYKVGFNNHSYFFREFKKKYQCSPREYRTKQQI